jgi:hypothetical protein
MNNFSLTPLPAGERSGEGYREVLLGQFLTRQSRNQTGLTTCAHGAQKLPSKTLSRRGDVRIELTQRDFKSLE